MDPLPQLTLVLNATETQNNNFAMLKNVFQQVQLLTVLTLVVSACNNLGQNDNEISNQADTLDIQTEDSTEVETADIVMFDSIVPADWRLDQNQLDSIKSNFQIELDSGVDMLKTAREEYNYLSGLKENYKAWLAQNCAKGYNEYNLNIDKWETSIQSAMEEAEKELRHDFGDENWGTDMDMMIYGTGSEQTYLFLEDLISSSRDWCN